MMFETKRSNMKKYWKKSHFAIRKNVFALLLFFGWSFGFVFQR
jgi:hypothetical protein